MGHARKSTNSAPARRVLIVDDEEPIRQSLTLMIKSLGFEVTAGPSIHAVDLSALRRSDFIFIDMMMPGADGIQVLEALSRKGIKSSIVLMSGTHAEVLTAAERIARQQGLRVAGVLKKPFRSRELRRILNADPQDQPAERIVRSSDINVEDLAYGLERREFGIHLQPIVHLATGRLVGFEALARWQSEKFSMVSPDRFIAVAARSGLLPRLTHQIASQAIKCAGELRDRGVESKMAINLGVEDFADSALPEKLAVLLAVNNLPAHSLIVELTELSASLSETKILEILARLRLKGIDLAIDDFGTSNSSLARLSVLPFTLLKIDTQFISQMVSNVNARTIVQSSINMAKRLNLTTVAAGIENEDQLRILRKLGCSWGQGYLFAPAMEYRQALEWALAKRPAIEPLQAAS